MSPPTVMPPSTGIVAATKIYCRRQLAGGAAGCALSAAAAVLLLASAVGQSSRGPGRGRYPASSIALTPPAGRQCTWEGRIGTDSSSTTGSGVRRAGQHSSNAAQQPLNAPLHTAGERASDLQAHNRSGA